MEVRVSPHRHAQSLSSRDVPSTLRLPSAIIHCVDTDDEKSTKNTKILGEEENIFCRRLRRLRLTRRRVLLAFLVLLLRSPSFLARKRRRARLCVRDDDATSFFLPRKRREKFRVSRHNNKRDSRRSKPIRHMYNKKELSIISRSLTK